MSLLERSALPIRPPRQAGESLPGYVYRLYNANGHAVPAEIHASLSLLYSNAAQGLRDAAGAQLAAVAGEFGDADWPQWRTSHSWLKQSYAWLRLCPSCLQENGIHQTLWELPLMTTCPTHRTTLSEHCDCGRRFTWRTIGADWQCRCGKAVTDSSPSSSPPGLHTLAHFISSPYGEANTRGPSTEWPTFSRLPSIRYEEIRLIHQLALKCSNRLRQPLSPKMPGDFVGKLLTDWPKSYVEFINHWLDVYFGEPGNYFARLEQNSPLIRMLDHGALGEKKANLTSCETLRVTLERIRVPVEWNGCFLVRPKILPYLNSGWLDDFYSMVPAAAIALDEEDFSGASSNDCRQTKLLREFLNRFISISCKRFPSAYFRRTAHIWPQRPRSPEHTTLALLAHLIAPLYRASSAHLAYLTEVLEKDFAEASRHSHEFSHHV